MWLISANYACMSLWYNFSLLSHTLKKVNYFKTNQKIELWLKSNLALLHYTIE
jgi:hypothetical protein